MNLIIDYYKELDVLNQIIFWLVIVVIFLLLIFLIIRQMEKKKLANINTKEKITKEEFDLETQEEDTILPIIDDLAEKEISQNPRFNQNEEKENITIAQELPKLEKVEESSQIPEKKEIEMPTGPYQRNVLREMALSQTSPIGITRPIQKEDKKNEVAKDLELSLNEIDQENEDLIIQQKINIDEQMTLDIPKDTTIDTLNNQIPITTSELLNVEIQIKDKYQEDQENEKYLEEVSRKLASADIVDEVQRTNYELKQEEDAIISYQELMSKKDSIQTIDEEEAIISIEELMRSHQETETNIEEDKSKLYNLGEEEENDNFIKELKQFRNDL